VPNLPYSAERDLVPLAPVAATPHILIVGPDFPAKNVQELLGHSTIAITMDVYGHLFRRTSDSRTELAASTAALWA